MKKNLLLALALAAACADAAPAYYRQQIGDLRVTTLFDGTLHLPRGDIKNIPAEDVAKLLADSSANEDEGGILASVNAFLIERGDEKVLVDSGTADCFASKPDKLGQVPEALAAAGINAADIKNILLTHGHSDHLCGLINADGSAAYPNATVWINATENRYWHSDTEKAKLPEAVHFLFDQARAALAPYEKAGKLKTFTDGDTLPLAAKAENANGHTIGHSAFRFNNGQGAALLVWGDLVHFPAIQFARPDASYSFDYDAAAGIASRQRLMQEAAEQHLTVAGAHLPFPGIGRVNKDNDGRAYRWRPVEYTPQ